MSLAPTSLMTGTTEVPVEQDERVHIRMSTLPRRRGRVEHGRIVGGPSTQQMVDDREQLAREDRKGFLLRPPAVHQSLVTGPPLRPETHGDQGRHVERGAQRPR